MAAQELYVAAYSASTIYHVVDGRVKAIPVVGNPLDLAASADGAYLYVSIPTRNRLCVIRTADDNVVARIATPFSPANIAIGNNDTRLFIANNSVNAPHIMAVDISLRPDRTRKNAVCCSIDLGPHNAHSAYSVATFGSYLAVGTESGHVVLYDVTATPAALVACRTIGARVMDISFSGSGSKVYAALAGFIDGVDENGAVTGPGNLHVLRVPSLALKSILTVGKTGLERAVLVRNEYLYVTGIRGGLFAIDVAGDRLIRSLAAGTHLCGIAADDRHVFVADPARDLILKLILGRTPAADRLGPSVPLGRNSAPLSVVLLPARR